MKIRIDDIPESGTHLSFSGSEDIISELLEAVPPPEGVRIEPHVKGTLGIVNQGAKVRIVGSIQAVLQLQCSRCLTDFSVQKTVPVDLVVAWGDEAAQLQEDSDESDENTIFLAEPALDVSELIVQEILLDIPMQPLCSEDCPGLCSRCGALKGSPECTCPRQEGADPRWGALARLKKDVFS
jgi:uncharacterized protein